MTIGEFEQIQMIMSGETMDSLYDKIEARREELNLLKEAYIYSLMLKSGGKYSECSLDLEKRLAVNALTKGFKNL